MGKNKLKAVEAVDHEDKLMLHMRSFNLYCWIARKLPRE